MKFTTGKLRRNAHKKINWLLDNATSIKGEFTHREIDDGWHTADAVECDKSLVLKFIDDTYARQFLNIWVTADEDGNPISVEVNGEYWRDAFTITFDVADSKPRATYEQVVQALKDGYVSPLNHDGKGVDPEPKGRIVNLGDYAARRTQKVTVSDRRANTARAIVDARLAARPTESNLRKTEEAEQMARQFESAAQGTRNNTAIASDDPDAINKLKVRLQKSQRSHGIMTAANAALRVHERQPHTDRIELLMKAGVSEGIAKGMTQPFSKKQLDSSSAQIRRIKHRIEDLELLHSDIPLAAFGDDWQAFEKDGRINFKFVSWPAESVRRTLHQSGFTRSAISGAWQRKITTNAVKATQKLIKVLNESTNNRTVH